MAVMVWIYYTFTLVFILITLFFYYMMLTFDYWKKRKVFQIPPIPIFGNYLPVFMFRLSPGELVQNVYNATTDKIAGLLIFRRPFLVIRDPELIKLITVQHFSYFNERSRPDCTKTDPIGCNNLFNMRNPHWRAMRFKLTPIFTSGQLKSMFLFFKQVGTKLNEYLKNQIEGEVLEMKSVLTRFSTDVLASVAFGVETNSFLKRTEFYDAALSITEFQLIRSIEFTSFFFALFAPFFVRLMNFQFFGKMATNLFNSVFQETVRFRKETGFKRNDLVDLLMKIENHKLSGSKQELIKQFGYDLNSIEFDNVTLAAQSAIFFTAGMESAASGISFCLQHLASRLDWQDRIQQEITQAMKENDGEITYESMEKMKFLNMCITETLRLYPPLPFLDRECMTDYTIPGTNFTIEKGTPILISLHGLHRDPNYFLNPEVFDPERWSDENKDNIIPYTYLPFGCGPRNCIAKRFSIIQFRVGLVYILKDFQVTSKLRMNERVLLDPKSLLTSPLDSVALTLRRID